MTAAQRLGWLPALILFSSAVRAQGVATAAIDGRVVAADGTAVQSATVIIRNGVNGAVSRTTTRSAGQYSVEHLTVGGPYLVEATAIGFEPTRTGNVFLRLGERITIDLTLAHTAVALEPVVVRGKVVSPRESGDNAGAITLLKSTVEHLPVRGRDVFQLTLLSPQAVRTRGGGLSLAGQSDRLNGLQIDGSTNNDLLGNSTLGLVGTPGQGLGARTLSPEAVEQLEIITAPFDVRFGNFAAGLINAVTRSGTNRFAGSIGSWYSGGRLIGKDPAGESVDDFDGRELDITLSGPIVQNRLAYFVDVGFQRLLRPQAVPLIGFDTTSGRDSAQVGIRQESVSRLQQILSRKYGVDAGTASPFLLSARPVNVFGKLTWRPAANSYIELSNDYSSDTPDLLTSVPDFSCREVGFFCLTSRSFRLPVRVNATRLAWIASTATGLENELRVSRLNEHNRCVPAVAYPGIVVAADRGALAAGSANFCSGESTLERILELTDNLTLSLGSHRLTVGGHAEQIRLPTVQNLQYLFDAGWFFSSLDSLEAGIPARFESIFRNPARAGEPISNLGVTQLGLYLQDQWSAGSRLQLTAGLRIDVPYLDHRPTQNPQLQTALGIDNGVTPTGNLLLSPRLGWSFRLSPDGGALLRGGVGVFAGRPPYKWFDQVYGHTGLEALAIVCEGAVPPFTLDPARQPQTCGQDASPAVPFVNVFNPNFRFPRNLKIDVGIDLKLPWEIEGTVDFLETRGLDQFALRDLNLMPPSSGERAEGGRAMYGAIDPSGFSTPSRRSELFGSVLEVRNDRGDRARVLSFQIVKRITEQTELRASYAYTQSRDRFSASEDAADANIGAAPIAGSLEDRRLANSDWSLPNKVGIAAMFQLPAGFGGALFYTGTSGAPFTYVVAGDANADGFGDQFSGRNFYNDAVYVPSGASDIALQNPDEYRQLDEIIEGEKCLRQSRGRILERNSCRNDWINSLDARLSKQFAAGQPRSVELIADVFNLFSLLGWSVGEVRETLGGAVPLVELTGYDAAAERGIYRVLPIERRVVSRDLSRWRIQLGARLHF